MLQDRQETQQEGRLVLVVDDDRDLASIMEAVLTDEGYRVAIMHSADPDRISETVGQREPDCILLDGAGRGDFGQSWAVAAAVAQRHRSIPVLLFTAGAETVKEVTANVSDRARAAGFAGIVTKPFDLDELLETVAVAVGNAEPFNHSVTGDAARTHELVALLEAGGAGDVRSSQRREWVTFRAASGALVQLYWRQQRGRYLVGCYAPDGLVLEPVGEFFEREPAIGAALGA